MRCCVIALIMLLFVMTPTGTMSRTRFKGLRGACVLRASNDRRVHMRGRLALFARATVGHLCNRDFVICGPRFRRLGVRRSCAHRGSNGVIGAPRGTFIRMLPSTTTSTPTCGNLGRVIMIRAKLRLKTAVCLSCSIVAHPKCLPRLSIYRRVRRLSPVERCILSMSMPRGGPLRCRLLGKGTIPIIGATNNMGAIA